MNDLDLAVDKVNKLRQWLDRLSDRDDQIGWQLRNLSDNLEKALDQAWLDRSQDEEERAEASLAR